MALLRSVGVAGKRLGGRASVAMTACCLVALSLLTAQRSANAIDSALKELHRPKVTVDLQSPPVRSVIDGCSRAATSKGAWGDVTVTVKDDPTNPSVSGSPALGSHREEAERCLREGLGTLALRLDLESRGAELPRWPGTFTLTIGEVGPLLPPLDLLLPRWERALNAPPEQSGEARDALAAVLPRGVSYRQDGCLGIAWPGPSVLAGLDMWARQSKRAIHELWFHLPFFRPIAPDRPSGVLVLSESRLLMTTPGQSPDAVCLRRLTPEEVQTVRSQIDGFGTCWAGNLEEILLSPRIAFPADKAFESLSTSRGQTCALEREGAMTCCGPRSGRDRSAARWRAISLGGSCNVRKSGDVECTFVAPPLKHQAMLTQGGGPTCVVDERGRPTCFEWSTRDKRAKGSRLDRGLPLGCRKRKPDGAEVCDTLREILPAGGSWPSVNRISASRHGVCAVSTDRKLLCSSRRPPVAGDATFSDVTTAPTTDVACALKTSGELLCWSQRDGTQLSFSQDAAFAALSPVIDQETVHGIGLDGKIVQAQWIPTGGLSTAAPKQPPPGTLKTVTAADGQVCGVTTAGRVLCWGTSWPGPNRRALEATH